MIDPTFHSCGTVLPPGLPDALDAHHLFAALPLASLDRLALTKQVEEIGRVNDNAENWIGL